MTNRIEGLIEKARHYENLWHEALDEQARLNDEVEQLKEGNECLGQMHDKEMERSAYLLEEFNRTTAEVERLRKELKNTDCMFAMASAFARDWNDAKEGKSE